MKAEPSYFLPHKGMDQHSIDAVLWKNARAQGIVKDYKFPRLEFNRIWNVGRERWPYSRRHNDKYVVRDKGHYRFTRLGLEVLKENGYAPE